MGVVALGSEGTAADLPARATGRAKRWYANLTLQVLVAMALGVLVGWLYPEIGKELKPLGDVFLRMIKMVIGPIVFLTVVTGISGIGDMKKVGSLGLRTIAYFEIVTTAALAFGLLVVNIVKPGSGLAPPVPTGAQQTTARIVAQTKQHSVLESIINIVPDNVIDAFAKLDVLQILFFAVLFGAALIAAGEKAKPVEDFLERLSSVLFGIIGIVIKFAPIGAFGAIAFAIATFGIGSLGSLAKLVASVYLTLILFVAVVLGLIARSYNFRLFKFILFIKDELIIAFAACNSEVVMPRLMEKLTLLGCSKSVVGLVVPTGYSMNQDGTAIYLSMGAIFIAQVYGVDLSIWQQLGLLAFMMFTSKGVGGVSGAGFVILASTITATGLIPVEGLALLLGVDRFMSEARALGNIVGNAVATVVIAKSSGEFDEQQAIQRYRQHFDDPGIKRL
jgi:aerobic C4-dicarboxylate transport protein